MMEKHILKLLQIRLGRTAVGPSTARGMGPEGTIKAARLFLQSYDLRKIQVNSANVYARRLDEATDQLVAALPAGGAHWGSARKYFNIFVRNCAYNRFICPVYKLDQVEKWMEVPMDSHVAKGLKLAAKNTEVTLPRWNTVIGMSAGDNERWQNFAQGLADEQGIDRVHLDIILWNGTHMHEKR